MDKKNKQQKNDFEARIVIINGKEYAWVIINGVKKYIPLY